MNIHRGWMWISLVALCLVGPAPAHAGTPGEDANTALSEFAQSDSPGVWQNLHKSTILAEIQARLDNPELVRQGPESFCGPAAIVFELVRRRPDSYVQFCQELYESGYLVGFRDNRVKASNHLLNTHVPSDMAEVDWMFMGTLRDDKNILFPVDPNLDFFEGLVNGLTTPAEMEDWTKNILGCDPDTVDYTSAYTGFADEVGQLRDAADALAHGAVVFALVTGSLVLNQDQGAVQFPNHWVSLLGNIQIVSKDTLGTDEDVIYFDVFSWGHYPSDPDPMAPRHVRAWRTNFEHGWFGWATGRW